MSGGARPKVAVWKFASCDGCQLTLLDCEDELLAIAGAVRIAHFLEATRSELAGPYDLSIVEGSISTPEHLERIRAVRAASKVLVTIGACATAGGIQGLRNFATAGRYLSTVYAHPDYVATLDTSTPVAEHVAVDLELHGCPIDRGQLLEVITATLAGRKPRLPGYSVCQECKARGTVCLLVGRGVACLGPVTRAGCGAICPAVDRGCFGCFGPSDSAVTAGTAVLRNRLVDGGLDPADARRLFLTYNANAPAFRSAGEMGGETAGGGRAGAGADSGGDSGGQGVGR